MAITELNTDKKTLISILDMVFVSWETNDQEDKNMLKTFVRENVHVFDIAKIQADFPFMIGEL